MEVIKKVDKLVEKTGSVKMSKIVAEEVISELRNLILVINQEPISSTEIINYYYKYWNDVKNNLHL